MEFNGATGKDEDIRNAEHPEEASTEYDAYVGKTVVVTGSLYSTNNAHIRAACAFSKPVISITG